MALPEQLARFNRIATNRLVRHVAGRLPGFAIVTHTGRRTAREYRTPVNLYRSGDRFVIALAYGSSAQWVRNVTAAGACDAETRGEHVHLVAPEIVRDPRLVPALVRPIYRAVRVGEFMVLRRG
jgi:deazaflavin-dependent oxidoreductase (nitroreductase family)